MESIQHIKITHDTSTKGFYDITAKIEEAIAGRIEGNGILLAYCMHTSASLCIQEAFDPSAKEDMQEFLDRLAPEHQDWHRHTSEGPDDTTSHLKSILTGNQVVLPIEKGVLLKGQWQGVYLCEHRKAPHKRTILLSLLSSSFARGI